MIMSQTPDSDVTHSQSEEIAQGSPNRTNSETPTTPAPDTPRASNPPVTSGAVESTPTTHSQSNEIAQGSSAQTPTTPNPLASLSPQSLAALNDLIKRLDEGQSTPAEQAMVQHDVQVVGVTAGELRAAAQARPGHALASHFVNAVKGMPDEYTVYVEQPDLQALLQNRQSVIRYQMRAGVMYRTKEIV